MNDVRVEVSYRLSNESETRYVVVDAMTGRVVDSAKGYGYTSYKKHWRVTAGNMKSLEKE